jgi:uncharacterized membrane protein YccC
MVDVKVLARCSWLRDHVGVYGPRLRFCLRMVTAAVLAFAVAQLLTVPLHGLWVVLTAVVVTQMSVGGSLRATAEYVIGTFGGAVYAGAIAVWVPHVSAVGLAVVLALAIAPLAWAAAARPSFRAAPFTAVLVLLISSQLGEGPIESAFYRVVEVGLGGLAAVIVSMLVFPQRAHGLGPDAGAVILDRLANALPELLAGVSHEIDQLRALRIQDEIGQAVISFQTIADEARRERMVNFAQEPDLAALSRTLLRLRHDVVIIGRAAISPLPDLIARRLAAPLAHIAAAGSEYLRGNARALASGQAPPALTALEAAVEAYAATVDALRHEGLTRTLPSSDLERLFALGFALDQLRRNFADLERHTQEWTRRSAP